ncbi:DUF748 domain-containing protein [Sutterella sp.]|uniref:DUF748 domain-containing protein n=1 Tax=Sutterella sp. TaxID=1981025 RepID=UPI003FD81555
MAKVLKFTACAAAVAVALYAAAGYVGVPYATRTVVEKTASEMLGRTVTLKDVTFNPWTWVYEIKGLEIPETGSEPLLKLALLRIDASSQTLFKLAPVLDEVTIDGLQVNAVMNEKNKKDFERLTGGSGDAGAKSSGSASGGSSGLPKFALYNISLTNSSLRYQDKATGIDESVTNLTVKLPFVSTMESSSESLVTPELSLKLNGSPIEATGSTKPFGTTLEAQLNLKISSLDVAALARLVPALQGDKLKVAGAKLSSDLNFIFRNPTGGKPAKMLLSGRTTLTDVSVTHKGAALVTLPKADVTVGEVDLVGRKAVVQNVTVSGLKVRAAKTKSGINLLEAVESVSGSPAAKSGSAEPASGSSSGPDAAWSWRVASASLTNADLSWSDATVSPAAKLGLSNLNVTVKDLSSEKNHAGSFTVAADALGGHVEASGTVAPAPLAVAAAVRGSRLTLNAAAPYVKAALGADLRAGIAFDVKADVGGGSAKASGSATVSDLLLRRGQTTMASAKTVTVKLAGVDTAKRSADVSLILVASPLVNAVMTKKGLNFAELGGASSGDGKKAEAAKSAKAQGAGAAWSWKVGEASVTNGTLRLRDESVRPVASAEVPKLNVVVKNLSSAKDSLGTLNLTSGLGGGSLAAAGKVGISPLAADLEVKGSQIGLKPFSSLMTAYAGVGAKGGSIDSTGRLSLKTVKEKTVAGWKGDLSLTGLDLTTASGAGLMSWRKASLTGVDLETTEPLHLVVAKAEIDQPAEKQTKAVREIAGIASLISSLTGREKSAEKIEKYSGKLSGSIVLENIRYENGKFSAAGVSEASLGGLILEKLSSSVGAKLNAASK